MGCILFSGAYFTPKAGMVGFLLLQLPWHVVNQSNWTRTFPGETGQREQLHPTRREPIRGGSAVAPSPAKPAKGSNFADTP
ncbi:hypothetical protein Tola_0542 [Tolumonas auensis DSM 9187]|uniref:Uncharacterized protein n=1 Tax=Tolumonas auensis (strain DSM 9187 / NBRC 110442 / TA 4) TaxID=595494 RepID=C4LA42_TOLAT|nr:hypothetical protein Tola_0542 [Tolumonas auensis DSM 9187]